MSPESMDESAIWSRVERALRRHPRPRPTSIDDVMTRVRGQRIEPAPRGTVVTMRRWLTQRHMVAVSPLQLIAACIVIGAAIGVVRWSPASRVSPSTPNATPITPVSLAESGHAARRDERPVQFVFVAKDARTVTIAGDFNDWNATATPLRRAGADGVWSIVLPLQPGRHLYSFVVDGRRWAPDAEAPRAPEDEFGESSVVLVERGS